jgi:hypothetical protein
VFALIALRNGRVTFDCSERARKEYCLSPCPEAPSIDLFCEGESAATSVRGPIPITLELVGEDFEAPEP